VFIFGSSRITWFFTTRRWEKNIEIVLREIGWGGMEWNHLTQDGDRWSALVNIVQVP
jgi:hypothetical protein